MNKYTVGGVILGIFLLASVGIRSAVNYLSSSTPETNTQDKVLSSDDARIRSSPNDSRSSSSSGSGSQNDADRLNSQSDGIFNEETISQADRGIDDSSAESSINAPLEEAGTYVQRQKRVEEDSVVAATDVNVIPLADASTVSAQGNTAVNPQPTAPETAPTSTSQPTAPAATSTPSAPAAVPALW